MKNSEYEMVCNLRSAEIAQHALREMVMDRDTADWGRRADAVDWLYQYCKGIYDNLRIEEEEARAPDSDRRMVGSIQGLEGEWTLTPPPEFEALSEAIDLPCERFTVFCDGEKIAEGEL